MRRLLTGLAVAAITMGVSTLAWAGNQEVADGIAKGMRASGRLSDYKISVKFQDGTAWLTGRVRSEEQKLTSMKLALATPGVERVVNNLAIGSSVPAAPAPAPTGTNPLAVAQASILAAVVPAPQPSRQTEAARKVGAATPSAVQPASATEAGMAPQQAVPRTLTARAPQRPPIPIAYRHRAVAPEEAAGGVPMPNGGPMPNGAPMPMYNSPVAAGPAPIRYDQPCLPNYAWPSYAAYPNYAALTYPKQYSPTVWPYIGPFYPYPQVPLGWRKVSLEWDDGWWFLDFDDKPTCRESPLGRWY